MDDYQLHMPVTSWHSLGRSRDASWGSLSGTASLDKYCLPAAPTVPDGADGSAPTGPAAEPAAPNWSSWTKRLMAEIMEVLYVAKTAKTATGQAESLFLPVLEGEEAAFPAAGLGRSTVLPS